MPIVIAQSLVAALDDGTNDISSQDIVAPLLFLLTFFFILALILSCVHITEFQVSGRKHLFRIDVFTSL